ncbi:MAG: nuclear transport factor 2 family protein [Oricola sp.]|nr:nuclear transport factor 2 family protein [Oricola sp.]
MKTTASLIAIGAGLVSAAQAAEIKTACTRGDDARIIEVVSPGIVGESCDVRYTRGGNVSAPYHADNADDFCNRKAREMIDTLTSAGFTCAASAPALRAEATSAPSDYVVEARRAAPPADAQQAATPVQTASAEAAPAPARAAMEPALVAVAEEKDDKAAALEEEMSRILAEPSEETTPSAPAQLVPPASQTPAQTASAAPQPDAVGRLTGAAPEAARPATPVTQASAPAPEPQPETPAAEPAPVKVAAAAPEPAPAPVKTAPTPADELRTPRDVIRATLDAQAAAWNDGDLDGFMNGYWKSDELKFVSGVNITKGFAATQKRYRDRYGNGEGLGQLSFDTIDVKLVTDDVAVTTGRFNLVRGPEVSSGVFSLVMRRDGGAWRIVHDHTSADPATN